MLLSTTDVQQLNNWAENNQDVTNQEVSTSDFYIAMQTETSLNVDPFDLTTSLTPGALLLLANIAAASTSLTKIELNNINIDGNATAFITALTKSTSLTTLGMYNINIGAEAEACAAALSQLPSLTNLIMNNNNISDNNAVAFVTALSPSTSLTTLCINTNVGDNTVVAFAAAISHLKNLIYLDFFILINPDVLGDVMKQLVNAPKLVVLSYHQNQFNQAKHADNLVKTAVHNTLNDALLEYLPSELINGVSWYAGNNEEEIDLIGLREDLEVSSSMSN